MRVVGRNAGQRRGEIAGPTALHSCCRQAPIEAAHTSSSRGTRAKFTMLMPLLTAADAGSRPKRRPSPDRHHRGRDPRRRLPMQLVDVKVCAVDDLVGPELVIRRRGSAASAGGGCCIVRVALSRRSPKLRRIGPSEGRGSRRHSLMATWAVFVSRRAARPARPPACVHLASPPMSS